MALAGFLLSTGAGGLGIVLSIVAIRRRRRRRKTNRSEASTKLCLPSADGSTTVARQCNPVLIKAVTTETSSKRRAVAVHAHVVTSDRLGKWYKSAVPVSYELDDNKNAEDHPWSKLTAIRRVAKQNFENAGSRVVNLELFAPMKEYTTQASQMTGSKDQWEENHESVCIPAGAVVDDDMSSSGSDSETQSCSFIDDDSLSGEQNLQRAEDDSTMKPNTNILHPFDPSQRIGKRVSFPVGYEEGERVLPPHIALDHHKPISVDFAIANTMEPTDEITSTASKAENAPPRYADSQPLFPITYSAEGRNAGPAPVIYDAVFPNQEAINSVEWREVALPSLRCEDQNPLDVNKSSYVSVEPMAQVSALDDVLTGSPQAMAAIVVHEPNYPIPTRAGFGSPTEKSPMGQKELESQEAMSLSKGDKTPADTENGEEKENAKGSGSSTPEKLSRKARQNERPGMFRRSSHPSLKRFRFPDRIRVRPLRNSTRNSK